MRHSFMSLVCGFPMLAMFASAATSAGTAPQVLAADVPVALKPYVAADAAVLVLNHVRVIDGTGAPAALDQRIDIVGGRIERVQSAKLRNALPPNARVLDLSGKTVMLGLVGMHEHLFYTGPEGGDDKQPFYIEMLDSGRACIWRGA